MGTGAVYVTLSGLKEHSQTLTNVETFFYFLNMALLVLNTTTLLLQFICEFHLAQNVCSARLQRSVLVYPQQSLRLIKDPVKGIFVPLIVLSFATIIIGTIKYAVPTGHVHPGFIYSLFWCALSLNVGCDTRYDLTGLYRVYVVFACVVCFPMLMVWFKNPHDLKTFTPAWAFLVRASSHCRPLAIQRFD